ncbi:MAG: DUF1491 family protein [Pseudomonadota bacterium]
MTATPRLSARFWVDAWLARARVEMLPAYVIAHGDDTAGAILVKCATLDGKATLWQRVLSAQGRRWDVLAEGAEADVDAAISRALGFDPDLWVLEVEDRGGRALLDD